jgi:hypothetical protein
MASRCASCFREGCRWGSWGVEAGGRVQQSSFGTLARSATRAPLHAAAVAEAAMLPRRRVIRPFARNVCTFRYARSVARGSGSGSSHASEKARHPTFARNVCTFRYARSVARVSGSGNCHASERRVIRPFARNVRTFRYARSVARVSGSGSSHASEKARRPARRPERSHVPLP